MLRSNVSILLRTFSNQDHIASTATRIIFTRDDLSNKSLPLCLKLWKACKNDLYDTMDVEKCNDYLLEGLNFNRKFAPGVYLGIAPVLAFKEPKGAMPGAVLLGPRIANPERKDLAKGMAYALVMKRLKDAWKLEHQLHPEQLGTFAGMEFLAHEIARMHKQMEVSDHNSGKLDALSEKIKLNIKNFDETLRTLQTKASFNIGDYLWISDVLSKAFSQFHERFKQRSEARHNIKRCHGDLKATNLWVRPDRFLFFDLSLFPQELLALDCVDFKPEFCHIDILSDVSMLAIDIEMHLTNWAEDGTELANHFLDGYLREVGQDKDETKPLLDFYLTEKAMVCTYMSITYDSDIALGLKYLDIALKRAQALQALIST